jgi:hypothetical protein
MYRSIFVNIEIIIMKKLTKIEGVFYEFAIYEIIGRKIGCTEQGSHRPTSQLDKGEKWRWICGSNNIYEASDMELDLQKEYGYPVDKVPYWKGRDKAKTMNKVNQENNHYKSRNFVNAAKNSGKNMVAKNKENGLYERFSKPVISTCKETGEEILFPSAHEAARQTGLKRPNITNLLNGKYNLKSAGGYYWRYATEEETNKLKSLILN